MAELDRIEVETGSVTTKVEKRPYSRAPLGSAVAAEIAKLKLGPRGAGVASWQPDWAAGRP